MPELERGIDPLLALPREEREQTDERQHDHDEGRVAGRSEGDEEPDRREAGVDGVGEALCPERRMRRAEALLTDPGDGHVERELGRKRPGVDRPGRPAREAVVGRRCECEHHGGPERMPRADEAQ